MKLAVSSGLGVNAIPWFKQIQKIFMYGLARHNGCGLKSLWAKGFDNGQVLYSFRQKKSPAQKGEAFSFAAWQ